MHNKSLNSADVLNNSIKLTQTSGWNTVYNLKTLLSMFEYNFLAWHLDEPILFSQLLFS